jgi:CubicO group peptidase (beta-lactamase class C family)
MNADGGIVSTAEDTARFLTALMQDRLLGAAAATRPTCGSVTAAAGLLRCF